MKTIYLAHPYTEQKTGKELQTSLEQLFFNVINPFARPIKPIKRLLRDRAFSNGIVQEDLRKIDSADMLVACVPFPSVGTSIEILYASQQNKPVFTLADSKLRRHPWLRRFSTAIFTHLPDLQKVLREMEATGLHGHPRVFFTIKILGYLNEVALHLRVPAEDRRLGLSDFLDVDIYIPIMEFDKAMRSLETVFQTYLNRNIG